MSVLVEVTQEDIDNGIKGRCVRCPVALAMNRRTSRTRTKWSVSGAYAEMVNKHRTHRELPKEARNFIHWFDLEKQVSPFKFWFPTVPHYATGDE